MLCYGQVLPLTADPDLLQINVSLHLNLLAKNTKIHLHDLQMDAFMFLSDDLEDNEGKPRKLVDIQEEFDQLSAQLSIYQGPYIKMYSALWIRTNNLSLEEPILASEFQRDFRE